MSNLTDIIIDFNEEISTYMSDKDIVKHIQWLLELDDPTDQEMIKQLKLLIFDYEKLDTLCYDTELTYMGLLEVLLRNYPSMLTPHFTRLIRLRYEEFVDVGTDKSKCLRDVRRVCGYCTEFKSVGCFGDPEKMEFTEPDYVLSELKACDNFNVNLNAI